jgi:hypothetical protein
LAHDTARPLTGRVLSRRPVVTTKCNRSYVLDERLGGNPGSPVLREHSIVWKWVVGSHAGRGGLLLWRPRAGRASQTAHGAVTGTTRPSNANPERSALKTTPGFEPLIMLEARGRNPPGESLYDLDSRQMCQVFIISMFVPSH